MTELKPCPFCGGKALYAWYAENRVDPSTIDYLIYCERCDANGPIRESYEDAFAGWNRRVTE